MSCPCSHRLQLRSSGWGDENAATSKCGLVHLILCSWAHTEATGVQRSFSNRCISSRLLASHMDAAQRTTSGSDTTYQQCHHDDDQALMLMKDPGNHNCRSQAVIAHNTHNSHATMQSQSAARSLRSHSSLCFFQLHHAHADSTSATAAAAQQALPAHLLQEAVASASSVVHLQSSVNPACVRCAASQTGLKLLQYQSACLWPPLAQLQRSCSVSAA